MQSAKETAANVAASAKAGMEKTKATLQEKGERMTTRDPLQKDMATQKKEERIYEAERQKQEARQQNVATRQAAAGGGTFGHDYTTGADYSTGTGHPMTGEGATGLDPTRTTTTTGTHDPNVAGGARTGYGSGSTI